MSFSFVPSQPVDSSMKHFLTDVTATNTFFGALLKLLYEFDSPYVQPWSCLWSGPVWPDLAKFRYFGNI